MKRFSLIILLSLFVCGGYCHNPSSPGILELVVDSGLTAGSNYYLNPKPDTDDNSEQDKRNGYACRAARDVCTGVADLVKPGFPQEESSTKFIKTGLSFASALSQIPAYSVMLNGCYLRVVMAVP